MTRPLTRALLGRDVATLPETATLGEAMQAFETTGRTAIAVLRRRRLCGVLLAEDVAAARPSACTTLSRGEVTAALATTPVAPIVRRDAPTVVPDTPVGEVARLLEEGAVAVPVLAGGRLVGLLEVSDLLGMPRFHASVINR